MGLWQSIKNLFWKGGAAVGVTKSLTKVTDDPRISISSDEYDRIEEAKRYYKDDFKNVVYKNSYGVKRMRPLQSLNVTKAGARRLASIIFNEQCKISLNDASADQLWQKLMEQEQFYLTFEEKLEAWIALGHGAIRPYPTGNTISFAWADADQVYPLKVNTNKVDEIAISSRTQRSESHQTAYYTLLEFHQWLDDGTYTITYELYRSTNKDVVGNQVPLNTLNDYASLPKQVKINNPDLEYPLFAFYRNPGANNKNFSSPLGLGLIDNCKKTVDAINMINDQFYWEVKMGKRRVTVPAEMLRGVSVPDGVFGNSDSQSAQAHPLMFDPDETVYQAMYGADDMKITDLTSPIRNDQYQAALDYYLHEFENQIGVSQGTFTATPQGIQTATEVVSNNSMTYQTRSSYLTQVEKTMKQLVRATFELAQQGGLFESGEPLWTGDVDKIDVNIDFNDGVFVDKDKQMEEDLKAVTAKALPLHEFLKRNYGLDDNQAAKWEAEIMDETPEPSTSAELGVGFGGDNNNDDAEEDAGSSGENS